MPLRLPIDCLRTENIRKKFREKEEKQRKGARKYEKRRRKRKKVPETMRKQRKRKKVSENIRKWRKRKKVPGLSEERRRKSPGDRDATVAILNLTKVMLIAHKE